MANEIKMPQLSDTMDSGKILVWHKKEGDKIARGDILAEVETDKANLEIEAFFPGVLLKVTAPAGTNVPVGELIAYIGEAGEKLPEGGQAAKAPESAAAPETPAKADAAKSEDPSQAANQKTAAPSTTPAVGGQDASGTQDAPVTSMPASAASNSEHLDSENSDARIKASPLAKKIAAQHGVNLAQVVGTGPGGRIVRKDVQSAVVVGAEGRTSPSGTTISHSAPNQLPIARGTAEVVRQGATPNKPAAGTEENGSEGTYTPLSKMRATIARRMQETVVQSPHFYVRTRIKMDAALACREQLKETPGYEKVSVNHLLIKAVGHALVKEPGVNNAMRNEMLFTPAGVHIGIVTSVDGGLMIPVIRNVPNLSLQDIAFEARAAIDRARAGRPSSSDLSGGTFSISNMGMFDVDDFTALINPGQGAILAVSATKAEAVVNEGRIEVAQMMNVTLSVDHRIIDGVMAGNFLKALKGALENPVLMML